MFAGIYHQVDGFSGVAFLTPGLLMLSFQLVHPFSHSPVPWEISETGRCWVKFTEKLSHNSGLKITTESKPR